MAVITSGNHPKALWPGVHQWFGLAYNVSREEIEDNKYAEVSKGRSRALARSMRQTKEVVMANIFNRAFNANYVGGDGLEMISTAHVTVNGTQSNELTVAADLSQTSLENLAIQ